MYAKRYRLITAGIALAILAASGVFATPARAGFMAGSGTDTSFEGFLAVSGATDTTATIEVDLTNTSPFDARITAWGFTSPAGASITGVGPLTVITGTLDPTEWSAALNPNAGPITVNAAAITGPNFNGGDPNSGIPNEANDPGGANPASFTLVVTGTGLTNLTQASILAAGFFVRFQRTGEDGEGSDRVQAEERIIPEPATVVLTLVGLGSFGVIGLRRRGRKADA